MKTLKILSLILFVTSFNPLWGQDDCACCDAPHREFDYWIGEWNVYDTTGKKLGENSITTIQDQCALKEEWTGSAGGSGTSINYFDNNDRSWNQIWVDNKGSVLKLKGKLKPGRMVLKSEILKSQNGKSYYNQISWIVNRDGTITQLWELFDEEDTLLRTAFKGIYKRK